MPLGPGNEHLPEKLHRTWEREIERRQARRAQVPQERATVVIRRVEIEAGLAGPGLSRGERTRLHAELRELREDAEDLRREQERLDQDIEGATRDWRAAVAAEAAEVLKRLCTEMDNLVDTSATMPLEAWAAAHLTEVQLISALTARWLNSMGESTNTTKVVGGLPLYARIPMWSRPSQATVADLITWVVRCSRYQQRLAGQEVAR
jgi:hypothetical protein